MKITIDVPLERIADLLCCGFENGIGYWAKIEGYTLKGETVKLGKPWNDVEYPHIHYPLSEGGAVIVREDEDSVLHRLDLETIQYGLVTMAEKAPRHFGDWLAGNDDSTTGDVFIQCCLLGKIVYG